MCPFGVEHVDRVVGDAFDEKAEAPFGVLQLREAGGELSRRAPRPAAPAFRSAVCSSSSACRRAAISRWLVW